MNHLSLNGCWELFCFPQKNSPVTAPAQLDAHTPIPAQVPGVAQRDLMRAGLLPEDIYFGQNVSLLRKYEGHEWWYRKRFAIDALPSADAFAMFCFDGIDCDADIYLNGEEIGSSGNALIPRKLPAAGLEEGENELVVHIFSPVAQAHKYACDPMLSALEGGYEGLDMRRPPSSYGWDILCRAVCSGLWRGVRLEYRQATSFTQSYLVTRRCDGRRAELRLFWEFDTDLPDFAGLALRLEGSCGDSRFDLTRPIGFSAGHWDFALERPKLWWPAGYGEQNLYGIKISLLKDGEPVCETRDVIGIRTVELRRTELATQENPGEFVFLVNNTKIFCKGSNWVPLDALHCEDAGRYEPALALFKDTHCNMLRCWGGNVYEDDRFYELCDEYGILVWQDFSMACGLYPRDEAFYAQMRAEAKAVIQKLRQHPSLALWSGDNECDGSWRGRGLDPNGNALTRRVLPDAVARCDGARPYLPSSPCIGPETVRTGLYGCVSEDHLWGPRNYFKSEFYTGARCHFVSEIGYHGCPNRSSIEKFIPPGKLWPWEGNPDWLLHSSEPTGRPDGPYAYRNKLMADQIAQLFGAHAQNLDDFVLWSQIAQAEAKKFFIEWARAGKWRKTGILWWNMLDGWPQFSDAVVDWYFGKKLAYWYIKRSQAHLCLIVAEPQDWHVRLLACNDTLRALEGAYRLWDADTGETLLSGEFNAPANETTQLARLRLDSTAQRLFLVEWQAGGVRGVNHYLYGHPPFGPARYRAWLEQIARLDGSFEAAGVGA
ncbi:MAG: hypothetical protein LBB75_02215 [Oscillospiraceae bacterium]|jgi:beta-mannosidase|nr:hypothetical protein [Oscillospiraceae bacterium]